MPTRLELRITQGTTKHSSSTRMTGAGRVVATIATALPNLGLTVTSTYIGAGDEPTTAVTVVEAPRERTVVHNDTLDGRELPVTHGRDRLLLHHAGVLLDVLSEHLGARVAVDVPQAQLDHARLAFPTG